MVEPAAETAQRKLLGAFYTQSETANAIARLAVRRSDEVVLDPCFGGCAFLEAVRNRFVELGSNSPMRRVFGVDIDPGAVKFLKAVRGARSNQFLLRDFLSVEPDSFGRFDVVVGNPPFVRHHLLGDDAVARGQARMSSDLKVPRTADSWLYFFHHALRFLKPDGCLAMVLPGSLLNAAYARSAREAIATRFASSDLFLVRSRLFADALESPVIVIARGFEQRAQGARLSVVDSPAEMVSSYGTRNGTRVDLTEKSGPLRLALLPPRARATLANVTHRSQVCQLGSIATVHIGVVTGANNFFILNRDDVSEHKLPRSAIRPILSTSKQFHGLDLRRSDLARLHEAGERSFLLTTTSGRIGSGLSAYLHSADAKRAQRAFKCRDRRVWHQVGNLKVPDAFLSYVIDTSPRLMLNRAGALCTNAIHRVWWRDSPSMATKLGWTMSMMSSLAGVSAELYGRPCGGGALKLEPSEAAALWMPASFRRPASTVRGFAAVAKAVRAGAWADARELADRAILQDELGLSATEASDLRDGHDELRDLRFSVAARTTPRAIRRDAHSRVGHDVER